MQHNELQANQKAFIMQRDFKVACSVLEKRKIILVYKYYALSWLFNDHLAQDKRVDNFIKTAFAEKIALKLSIR